MSLREVAIFAPLIVLVILMGVYPAPFLDIMHVSVANMITNIEFALNASAAISVAGN